MKNRKRELSKKNPRKDGLFFGGKFLSKINKKIAVFLIIVIILLIISLLAIKILDRFREKEKVSLSPKEMSPEYQKKFPDPAFLFGSTNIGISEILGLEIHPSVVTGLSHFSGIYKDNPSYKSKHFNYQNVIYPEYILKKPLKILDIPFYISIFVMLFIITFIFLLSFLIFKRKEFY